MRVQVWGGSQEEEATCIESLQHPTFLFVLDMVKWYILFFYILLLRYWQWSDMTTMTRFQEAGWF